MRAGFLQARRELDVRGFVEARHQLDDDGDFLAGARRIHQRVDDRRLRAGAVQRLLDREHVGIRCRLAQEIDDRCERFERMMQQQLALAHDREDVFLGDEPFRNARRERRIFEVGTIDQVVDRHQAIEVDRSVDLVQIVLASARSGAAGNRDVLRTVERSFQTHCRAVATLGELAFDGTQQVVDFFVVDEQIAVARHAKLPGAFDCHAAEQLRHERRDDRRQKHEMRLPWDASTAAGG